eukprot:538902_1
MKSINLYNHKFLHHQIKDGYTAMSSTMYNFSFFDETTSKPTSEPTIEPTETTSPPTPYPTMEPTINTTEAFEECTTDQGNTIDCVGGEDCGDIDSNSIYAINTDNNISGRTYWTHITDDAEVDIYYDEILRF